MSEYYPPDPADLELEWLEHHLRLADSYPRDTAQQIAAAKIADYQANKKASGDANYRHAARLAERALRNTKFGDAVRFAAVTHELEDPQ